MVGATAPRVIQWATGSTGMFALRHLVDSPDLELVGVRVYEPDLGGVVDADTSQFEIGAVD